ncbi:MAG: acetyl-CoA synthetase [Proteobacteria bacterium]|nr:MAG: acetyl-CoA synthetase [Pseudomonadota bacterium]PIE40255.1 MAG: acetyl-CoA synthetase [Gammaproteobacteria bacterium]
MGLDDERSGQDAIIVDDESSGVSSISYANLEKETARFANCLSGFGLPAQNRVLIRLPNCLQYPVAFLGALRYGAIAVPASMMLTAEELVYLINDSQANVIVVDARVTDQLREIADGCPSLQHIVWVGGADSASLSRLSDEVSGKVQLHCWDALLAGSPDRFEPVKTLADDPAYLVYTSGTTGYPKGVLHAHRALPGRMPASQYWFPFEAREEQEKKCGKNDRILHSGKFNWTYVLGTALMDPLFQGKTVIVHEGEQHADTWPKLIAKHRCSIFIGVPTLFRQILQKTTCSSSDVPCLIHCMSAGEHLSDEVLAQWKQRFGLDVYEAVGMSECSYYLSQHNKMPIRPGSAGFPQPGHDVVLLDKNLNEVPAGEEGMLCIPETDPALFIRYWNLEEETKKSRKGGFFLTGDYARQDEEGYIWFLGRKDDMINSFGFRVSPVEVERVIKTHDAVSDCAVVGEEVAKDKIIVSAYVILHDSMSLNEDRLIEFCREHLATYKMPRKVSFLSAFPRTANGKVLRSRLITR